MIQPATFPHGNARASHCFQWLSRVSALLAMSLTLTACGGGAASDDPPVSAPTTTLAQLGEKIFHDTSLSASGMQSCATCHDPSQGGGDVTVDGDAPDGSVQFTVDGDVQIPADVQAVTISNSILTDRQIELTPPAGFTIDSFVAA